MLVEAQRNDASSQAAPQLGGACERLHGARVDGSNQRTQRRAGERMRSAREDAETNVVERLEVEDAFDAERSAEEERQHQAQCAILARDNAAEAVDDTDDLDDVFDDA
jgi:hypothetical protein